MKKIAPVLVVLMIASIFLTGCSLTDKLASMKQSFSGAEDQLEVDTNTPTVVIETPNTTPVVNGDTKMVTLFFADESGQQLVMEEREIPKVVGIARVTVEELIKGPTQVSLKSTLPNSTQLLDINVRTDGLAIVDFSGDLIKDLPASAQSEKLAVYSIVNTLTQFPTVEKVEMRIDGKRVDTLLGHVKLNKDLVRDASLIR